MLETPLGKVVVKISGEMVSYEAREVPKNRYCPNVSGRYVIEIDAGEHTASVSCELMNAQAERAIESGERLEALALYENRVKLSIGIGVDFLEQAGHYLARGIALESSGKVRFGVCWIEPVTADNDVETWFGVEV